MALDLTDLAAHGDLMCALVRWKPEVRGGDCSWYRATSWEVVCSICFGGVQSVDRHTIREWLRDHQAKHLAQLDQSRILEAEVILSMWRSGGALNGSVAMKVIPIIWPEGHPVPYGARDVG